MMRNVQSRRCIAVHFAVAIWICLLSNLAFAQDASDKTRESFSKNALPSTVWFDPDEGKVVPVRVQTSVDDSEHRDSLALLHH